MSRLPILRFLLTLAALALAAGPDPLRAQGTGSLVLVGVDSETGMPVPVGMELVRKPGEIRIDPRAGRLSVVGAEPGAPAALLALEPTVGSLVAVELRPVRIAGSFTLDPRTGTLTAAGLGTPPPAGAGGPILIGSSSGTGTLVPLAVELTREPASYAIDAGAGVVTPSPREPALFAFDPASQSLVLVRLALVRGEGGLAVDPVTRRLSRTGGAPAVAQAAESFTPLGTRSDAGGLVAVDLDLVHRGGVLAVDPGTGALRPARPELEAAGTDELQYLGVHSLTGALGRVRVEPVPRSGEYAVNAAGTVSPIGLPEAPPEREAAGLVFGAGLDLRQMLKLQDVLAQVPGATGADAGKLAPGLHGFVEYAWPAVSLGIEAAYSATTADVTFPQGIQAGDLTYRELGGSLKITLPFAESARPYATVAILRSWSKGDFELEGLSDERTHNTTRAGIGAGFDYWARPQWGLRVEAVYITTLEDDDAGEQIRWRAGAIFRPGGGGDVD